MYLKRGANIMEYGLSHLRIWLYQIWQPIDAIKLGTDEEIFWGLLKILGLLGFVIVVAMIFSHRKSQEIV
jgi:hypothetical protein